MTITTTAAARSAIAGSSTTATAPTPSRTASTAAFTAGCHLGALLAQDRFAGQLDAVTFHGQHFHQDLISFFQLVFHFFHAMLGDFADVQKAVGAGENLHESAELGQAHHFAQISLANFRHGGEVVDHLNGFLRGRSVARSHVDFAGVVYVDLDAGLVNDAADHLAARTNQVADFICRNLQGVNARREVGDILASAGDGLLHLVENVQASAAGLLHR